MINLSAVLLLIVALTLSVTARAEEGAGGNTEPETEQSGSTEATPQTEPKPETSRVTKGASDAAEPGCN